MATDADTPESSHSIFKNSVGEKEMRRKYNEKIVSAASMLRRNMTKEEKRLWYDFLRTCPVPFSRQKILGKYIADFYSASAKMVIEIDGSGHYTEAGKSYDKERTEFLEGYGLRVIRIPNTEIHDNFDGVCSYIEKLVNESLK